jgi:hypothetical protein
MRSERVRWLAIFFLFACKEEVPKPPPATQLAAPPPAEPAVFDYGDKYLVILSSSPTPGAEPASLATIGAKPELGARVARLDSSQYKNLMPCYEIVIARAFDSLASAKEWSGQLAALKIDHYVKNAGKFVGRLPAVEAYCEAKKNEPPDACGGVRFVEKWAGGLLMGLGEPADEKGLAPWNGERKVWRAPLDEKIHGAHRVGDVLLVLDPGSAEPMRCKVKGFSAVVRGHPHFGYFEEPPKPDRPGCGEPELFAELECPRAIAGEVALAVAHDRPAPAMVAFDGPEVDEHPLGAAAVEMISKLPEFARALEEAEREAKERKAELSRTFSLRAAKDLLVVRAIFSTGEGLIECGGEDVRIEIQGALALKDGALGAVVLPFRRVELKRLGGILDLEKDGKLETFDIEPPARFSIRRGDDQEACGLVVPFCDCGC